MSTSICMPILSLLCLCNIICESRSVFDRTYALAHNAYHQRKSVSHTTFIDNQIIDVFVPVHHYSWPSLSELLDHDVCGFEIDIYPNDTATDFQVHHYPFYDDISSCNTWGECLTEISDWIEDHNGPVKCPITITLELKLPSLWTNNMLILVNEITKQVFSRYDQLYTPEMHGASPHDVHWPTWKDSNNEYKIEEGQVFVTIDDDIILNLFPNSEDTLLSVDDYNTSAKYLEEDFIIFPRCKYPTSHRFCVFCTADIRKDETWKDDYIWIRNIDNRFIQILEYPVVDIGFGAGNYFIDLPGPVTNDFNHFFVEQNLDQIIPLFGYEYNATVVDEYIVKGSVPYQWWNTWLIFAYVDGLGNKDGKIDATEFVDFLYAKMDQDDSKVNTVELLDQLTTPLKDLGFDYLPQSDLTLDGLYVNDPLGWLVATEIINGYNPIKPRVPASDLFARACIAIDRQYQYVKTDYPYQFEENRPQKWEFAFNQVDCSGDEDVGAVSSDDEGVFSGDSDDDDDDKHNQEQNTKKDLQTMNLNESQRNYSYSLWILLGVLIQSIL